MRSVSDFLSVLFGYFLVVAVTAAFVENLALSKALASQLPVVAAAAAAIISHQRVARPAHQKMGVGNDCSRPRVLLSPKPFDLFSVVVLAE